MFLKHEPTSKLTDYNKKMLFKRKTTSNLTDYDKKNVILTQNNI